MFLDHGFQLQHIVLVGHILEGNHLLVETAVKIIFLVQDIGNAAAHACREILSRGS